MPKPSLAFVDHELHQKTKSSDFLRNLFRESFEVHDYWDATWRGGPTIPPEELNKHDYIFYLQVLNPFNELKKITKPILLAPMYDSYKPTLPYWKMISYFNIKILSFSEAMAKRFEEVGIPTMHVKYYYLRPEKTHGTQGNHIFFWYRGGVSFDEIKKILKPSEIDSFTFLEAPDAGKKETYISEEDLQKYKIRRISGFLPHEKFLELVEAASIFIAPRKKEGIGAFTEPLALGKAVIAYDEGVQNEYITNGVDGYLFDENSGLSDLSKSKQIGEKAFARAVSGYAQWEKDKANIIPFLLEPHTVPKKVVPFWIWSVWYFYCKLIGSSRYYVGHKLLRRK